jgi:hypothetical protein
MKPGSKNKKKYMVKNKPKERNSVCRRFSVAPLRLCVKSFSLPPSKAAGYNSKRGGVSRPFFMTALCGQTGSHCSPPYSGGSGWQNVSYLERENTGQWRDWGIYRSTNI